MQVRNTLKVHGYQELFWRGDGGVFYQSLAESQGFVHGFSQAIDQLFEVFDKWNRPGSGLSLRISGTALELISDLIDKGLWYSTKLNVFIKFERQFFKHGSVVVTKDLRKILVTDDDQHRFPKANNRTIVLPNQQSIEVCDDVRFLSKHIPKKSFSEWLEQFLPTPFNCGPTKISGEGLMSVGKCTLIQSSRNPEGYADARLDEHPPIDFQEMIRETDRAAWKVEYEKRKADKNYGYSTQVVSVGKEIEDDYMLRLKYCPIDYCRARAFHDFLLDATIHDQSILQHYRNEVLKALHGISSVPGILSTAIIVIVGGKDEAAQLVIARRGPPRSGGYHDGKWAVSIGEQHRPVDFEHNGKLYERDDQTITSSIKRGLKEELLGMDFEEVYQQLNVCVHGVVLEDYFCNFMLLAFCDLRPISFSELAALWRKAPDRAEHSAIAALEFTHDLAFECVNCTGLSENIIHNLANRGMIVCADGVEPSTFTSNDWQDNSHIRLLYALWNIESELK